MSKTITLGQHGVYIDSEGKAKSATVIGTHTSIRQGTGITRPEDNRVTVLVTAPNGKTYVRENIRTGEGTQVFLTVKAFAKRPVEAQPVYIDSMTDEDDEEYEDDDENEDDDDENEDDDER